MQSLKSSRIAIIVLSMLFFSNCKDEPVTPTTVTDDFESGSIGEMVKTDETAWELCIANDNDDTSLPESWRSWWYVKMEQVATYTPTQITVKNSGWPYYYVPVYSYDQQAWHHFSEDEVTQTNEKEIQIQKQFEQQTVWIARFYPYTFSDLETYLNSIRGNVSVDIQIPGYSQEGKPLYLLKITDPSVPVAGKKRIFMHARTHPAETPPSFVIEGIVNYLLSGTAEASDLLSRFEFYIFPMQNVDGVIAGNYRSTPKSENLEVMWFRDSTNSPGLTSEAPVEVTTIQQVASQLMNDGGPAVTIALNLHASNSEPDICPFFYPHFGPESKGYSPLEASLWDEQLAFIGNVENHYGSDHIEPVPNEGGSSFASKMYPESWWWNNYSDQVMAMTFEMTYGRAGHAPRWVEPDDYRNLGVSLALGIRDYSDGNMPQASFMLKSLRDHRIANLKYPELYPPDAEDEMKK